MANTEQLFENLCKIYSKSGKEITNKASCEMLFIAVCRDDTYIANLIIQMLNNEIERKSCRCLLYTVPSLWNWLRNNCYEDIQYEQLLSKRNIA